MTNAQSGAEDLALTVVRKVGGLVDTGDRAEPFRLVDPTGCYVPSVAEYFRELQARGQSTATLRSYGMDLLRWFRFCWAIDLVWDHATRAEARDFSRWLQISGKPARSRGNRGTADTGTTPQIQGYSASVRAHSETVLRSFYEFHLETGTGPIMNPFPLDRARRGTRAHAHHNPMEPYRNERSGQYRPRLPNRIPRSIPDGQFNEIFALLPSHRDRALVAFYVSTGARASELLSVTRGGVDPAGQLITVVRKGTRHHQQLPASTDAFVWLRLYQAQMEGLIPTTAPTDWPCPRLVDTGLCGFSEDRVLV
ncbi:site-specific integrase [Cryobacterium sp. PH31-AA6]|uniref:tyrosine-type recombinase/integrase n=1 Tax=Cryobacterium sp. PH31-AA6 TaxID=3046205 RepID=UPI0024B99300|nr:site-specific integrase [Cryobacterium sp. PH31-AA6]MDJ0325199.1 site-specific integrase [Cryobacterium sp. PH31-AA6]